MSIVLFAIIGATIKAGTAYWLCFGGFCLCKLLTLVSEVIKETKE